MVSTPGGPVWPRVYPQTPSHLSFQGDFVTLQVLPSRPLLHELSPQLIHLVEIGEN